MTSSLDRTFIPGRARPSSPSASDYAKVHESLDVRVGDLEVYMQRTRNSEQRRKASAHGLIQHFERLESTLKRAHDRIDALEDEVRAMKAQRSQPTSTDDVESTAKGGGEAAQHEPENRQ